ncbi:MAG TPA: hypothetical protein VHN11_07825 [Xanthobacteraceae bacterium]|jgi:hypothetical protein|nr:hypothetical protein [Xanthobacteraceae bacterium]
MPARVKKIRHDENTRAKIQVAELVNRFHRHFMGLCDLSPTQIQAGKILLDRALPVLQSVEVSGEITTSKVIRTPTIAPDIASWQREHAKDTLQ